MTIKRYSKRSLFMFLMLCVLILGCPTGVITSAQDSIALSEALAVTQTTDAPREYTLADVAAGIISLEDLYGPFNENTVPAIIGYDTAVERGHIARLREEEGDDLNTLVFLNADATQTMYVFDHPVKYVDSTGAVQDISLNITENTNTLSAAAFTSADGAAAVTQFSQNAADGIALSGNGVSVSMVPHLPAPNTSVMTAGTELAAVADDHITMNSTATLIDNRTISYPYDGNTTLEYSLTYTGFKEEIVVSEYTGQTHYVFTLYTNGLTLIDQNGSFFLTDSNGAVRAAIGDIIVFTADNASNTFGELTARTVVENEQYLLTVVLDAAYLADEKTVYPIRIDPTVEISYDTSGAGAISDVTIYENATSSPTSSSLFVGKRESSGISRVLMKFPKLSLSSLGSNIEITSATIQLRDLMCEAEGLGIYCYVFAGDEWEEETVNWSNANPDSVSTMLSYQVISYANGAAQPTPHWYTFDITEAVRGWEDGIYYSPKGLLFKSAVALEYGATYMQKTFASYNCPSYKPVLSVTYRTLSTFLEDGVYYINNKGCGDYLKWSHSSTVSAESGFFGSSIVAEWVLENVNGGYVLRAHFNETLYLGISETQEDTLEIVTISEAAIPSRCIWNITVANGGNCLIQNLYNSHYLYSYGSTVYTSETKGSVGSTQYASRVWRIIKERELELSQLTLYSEFHDCYLMVDGQPSAIAFTAEPNTAVWIQPLDFTYSGYDTSIISINPTTAYITPKAVGTTIITVLHKPTDQKFYLKVEVIPSMPYRGTLTSWADIQSNVVAYWVSNPKVYYETVGSLDTTTRNLFINACESARTAWNSALGISITRTNNKNEANIIIYGGTRTDLRNNGHVINDTAAGNTKWNYIYSGYYTYYGTTKIEAEMKSADVIIALTPTQSDSNYSTVCTHELGHALGFNGHAASPSAVMYYIDTPGNTLQSAEINHLRQIYS